MVVYLHFGRVTQKDLILSEKQTHGNRIQVPVKFPGDGNGNIFNSDAIFLLRFLCCFYPSLVNDTQSVQGDECGGVLSFTVLTDDGRESVFH